MTRATRTASALLAALVLGGCSAPAVLVGALGIATDTSVPWSIIKHVHGKLADGYPQCFQLDSVERALEPRCGEFSPGSLRASDVAKTGQPVCALARAARDPRLWPALPELIDKGAQPETCSQSPLVDLAQAKGCPEFSAASPRTREALLWLAQADARAVHHDVVRMFSCPAARQAGYDSVIAGWLAQGALHPDMLTFSALSALHPDALGSDLSTRLEAAGHGVRGVSVQHAGKLAPGFEEALRTNHWVALDWWLARAPELANRVPAPQGGQLPWIPLARVLVPTFMADPTQQSEMVGFLLARGADPMQRLPHQPGMTVLRHSQSIHSPLAPLLAAAVQAQRLGAARIAQAPQHGGAAIVEAAAGATAFPVASPGAIDIVGRP